MWVPICFAVLYAPSFTAQLRTQHSGGDSKNKVLGEILDETVGAWSGILAWRPSPRRFSHSNIDRARPAQAAVRPPVFGVYLLTYFTVGITLARSVDIGAELHRVT